MISYRCFYFYSPASGKLKCKHNATTNSMCFNKAWSINENNILFTLRSTTLWIDSRAWSLPTAGLTCFTDESSMSDKSSAKKKVQFTKNVISCLRCLQKVHSDNTCYSLKSGVSFQCIYLLAADEMLREHWIHINSNIHDQIWGNYTILKVLKIWQLTCGA